MKRADLLTSWSENTRFSSRIPFATITTETPTNG